MHKVELRWREIYSEVVVEGQKRLLKTVLEYRERMQSGEWSEWVQVPTVK